MPGRGSAGAASGKTDAARASRTATAVLPGRTYAFRVAAYNDAGNSSWLVSDAYDVSDSNFVPAAPTGLVFGNYDAARQTLPMSWNDNSSNEKGFMVEYSIDGGTTWKVSEYLGADATSRTASRVYPGREYSFDYFIKFLPEDAKFSDFLLSNFSLSSNNTNVLQVVDNGTTPTNWNELYNSKKVISIASGSARLRCTWKGKTTSGGYTDPLVSVTNS